MLSHTVVKTIEGQQTCCMHSSIALLCSIYLTLPVEFPQCLHCCQNSPHFTTLKQSRNKTLKYRTTKELSGFNLNIKTSFFKHRLASLIHCKLTPDVSTHTHTLAIAFATWMTGVRKTMLAQCKSALESTVYDKWQGGTSRYNWQTIKHAQIERLYTWKGLKLNYATYQFSKSHQLHPGQRAASYLSLVNAFTTQY